VGSGNIHFNQPLTSKIYFVSDLCPTLIKSNPGYTSSLSATEHIGKFKPILAQRDLTSKYGEIAYGQRAIITGISVELTPVHLDKCL
jgi:hypothetical protein